MQVFGLPRQVISSARVAAQLGEGKVDAALESRRDAVRRWREARAQGLSAQAAADAVGVSRATLYRWRKQPELRSRRPRKLCRPRWSPALVERVEALREDNPVWGKRKLGPLLRAEGHALSDSTVGRILARLVRRGRLQPVFVFRRPPGRTRRARRPYARRLRAALPAKAPGEAVQIDTLSLTLLPGKTIKHFTALDRYSRWTAAMAASQATSASAARFLDKLVQSAPFPIRAIQVDGGSEFQKDFENACQQRRIDLYVLPPRSPQLNGRVERMQATWRYEFYSVYSLPHRLQQLNPLIDAFAHRYNHHRPHDALDSRSPIQYLHNHSFGIPPPSHMS